MYQLCGEYKTGCRASDSGMFNVVSSMTLDGNDVGTFITSYATYDASDVDCLSGTKSSYTIYGTYAMHGTNGVCDGECQDAVKMEVFANKATFVTHSSIDTDNLNVRFAIIYPSFMYIHIYIYIYCLLSCAYSMCVLA
jgi:hypothetical protein